MPILATGFGNKTCRLTVRPSRPSRYFMNIEMLQYSGVVTELFVSGCCFVTFFTRKSALDAQNALHNIKTLAGVS